MLLKKGFNNNSQQIYFCKDCEKHFYSSYKRHKVKQHGKLMDEVFDVLTLYNEGYTYKEISELKNINVCVIPYWLKVSENAGYKLIRRTKTTPKIKSVYERKDIICPHCGNNIVRKNGGRKYQRYYCCTCHKTFYNTADCKK